MGDSRSEPGKVLFSFLAPTWAAITSEAPCVVNFCPVHGAMARVDLLTAKVPMGRLCNKIKKTGTVSVRISNLKLTSGKTLTYHYLPFPTTFLQLVTMEW